ncbi:hypothetical protein, partial [Leuconostoc mesenteroides]|uniref:hypothetical protein n=1 Tax=Leuconostoc mesenteroides TaxID=1245 RepID=UPI00235E1309
YRLNNKIDVDESTKRILFHASKRLYFDNAIKKSIIMPKLDQWSAQNPVLYYKQYLQSKKFKLSDEDVRELNHIISPETYVSIDP